MRCVECGYKNEDNVKACVKCGTAFDGSAASSAPEITVNVTPTHQSSGKATVVSGAQNVPAETPAYETKKTVQLKDIQFGQTEAGFSLTDLSQNKKTEFKGPDLTLKRDDIDSSNNSISSSAHVQFMKKEDGWYIKNYSTNGATFIQVTSEMKIEAGASIIIGNKIYKFEA